MKKICGFAFLLLVLVLFTSCFRTKKYAIPYGLWKSDDPDITLNIVSGVQMASTGVYIINGEAVDVFLTFRLAQAFYIQNVNAYHFDENYGDWSISGDNYYFNGEFKLKDGKLYYYAHCSEHSGYEKLEKITIVFDLVEEYREDDLLDKK